MLMRLLNWFAKKNGMILTLGYENRLKHSLSGDVILQEMYWPLRSGKTSFIKLLASGTTQYTVGNDANPIPLKLLILTAHECNTKMIREELEAEVYLGRVEVKTFRPEMVRCKTREFVECDYILFDEIGAMDFKQGHPMRVIARRFEGARKPVPTKLIGMY